MAKGGVQGFFVGFREGANNFFDAVRGGKPFFCPPDVVFISNDRVINATSLTQTFEESHKLQSDFSHK